MTKEGFSVVQTARKKERIPVLEGGGQRASYLLLPTTMGATGENQGPEQQT